MPPKFYNGLTGLRERDKREGIESSSVVLLLDIAAARGLLVLVDDDRL